jgi:hypothetical protein
MFECYNLSNVTTFEGVKTVTQEYRPSKRVEDQEAASGPTGIGGGWNAAGAPGRPRYDISYPKSTKSLISKGKL